MNPGNGIETLEESSAKGADVEFPINESRQRDWNSKL